MLKGVKTRLEDLNMVNYDYISMYKLFTKVILNCAQVLNQTRDHRQRVLTTVAKELHNWGVMVRKMKAIYHTLNLFNMDVTKKCLIGECWIPIKDLSFIRHTLAEGSVR